jgi:DNA-binding HxlR family transcriptional regulator
MTIAGCFRSKRGPIGTRSKAIAVEYSLTQLGRTLIAPHGGMCRWARRHRRHVSANVRLPETHQPR